MDHRQQRLADELEDVLDRERGMLRTGSLRDLSTLAEHKARLMAKLSPAVGSDALIKLREKASRNARMLDAAAKGIRSVTDRIATLRSGSTSFSTYSASGARATVGTKASRVERRA